MLGNRKLSMVPCGRGGGGGGVLKPQMGKHLLGGNEPSEHHPPSTALRISQVFAFLNPSIIILPCTAISNFFILTH